MECIYCQSISVVKRGKSAAGSQRFICNECKKTFTTTPRIPFEFIAFLLYFNDLQEKSNPKWMMSKQKIKKLKDMTERFLSLTDIRTKKVSRRTLYCWINKYGENYKKSITKEDALNYYVKHLKKKTLDNSISIEDINEFEKNENNRKVMEYLKITKQQSSHKEFLKLLGDALGKNGAKNFLADYEKLSKEQKKRIKTNLLTS